MVVKLWHNITHTLLADKFATTKIILYKVAVEVDYKFGYIRTFSYIYMQYRSEYNTSI